MPDDLPTTPTTVRVRRATTEDAPALAGLAALTFPLACPPGTSPEAIAEHVATQLSSERFRAWAASAAHALLLVEAARSDVSEGIPDALGAPSVLGYALLVRGVPDDPDVAAAVGTGEAVELSKIYVHPAAQGTGVAGVLMTAAAEAAARLGPGLPVWLGTNGLNARAQAFYRKHRFDVVGGRTYAVGGETHTDVVMALPRA
ncbi:GNAT family N-acetyltransferase [Cellulosimicrobium cellulans]|uniref:GNAT family N-acetyltransferase n=1 Tax=Cellulosimicrobium cellulans TaxID=1710 RepID=UPI001EDC2070|nr:GNAT family N-acetyltransferase [Cellulosimicrobium cellulans]UKJ65378.1 GNAT family N-acetyltransferase [Cellulosimicrobium cellulans]